MEYRKRSKSIDMELRLRVPREFVTVLKKRADRNGRSRNAEALVILATAVEKDGR